MKLKHKTAILTTPDNKLIQLEWSELEEVYGGNKVRIAGTEYEVTALDWAFCDRVLKEGVEYVEAK